MPNKLVLIFSFVFLVIAPAYATSPEQPNSVPADQNSWQMLSELFKAEDKQPPDLNSLQNIVYLIVGKANRGDPNAQYVLGFVYSLGSRSISPDHNEAFKWLTKSAEQGNTGSLLLLSSVGYFYENGYYYQDGTKQLYSQDHNFPPDYNEAFKWFKKAAELGLSEAQINLGVMYIQGKGIPIDYKEAFEWFTKAAEQGDAVAKHNLGLLYFNGKGVPKDCKKAVQLFRNAAEQGNSKAQYALGAAYYDGKGVIEDYVEAYKWALIAGMNGEDVTGFKQLIAAKLTPTQIYEARRLAQEFAEKQEKERIDK